MQATVSLAPLYGLQGWAVKGISVNSNGYKAWVYLRVDGRGKGLRCPRCSQRMGKMRERRREVSDLPSGTASVVHLVFTAYQGRCAHCGNVHAFRPRGIDGKPQGTDRLKRYVSLLCRFMLAYRVPNIVPISIDTARRWDKQVLMATLPEPKLDGIQAVQRHYRTDRRRACGYRDLAYLYLKIRQEALET